MKPKPPKSCWCCVDLNGKPWTPARTRAEAAKGSTYIPSDRIIRYIPAPTKRRKKPRRKGYRAGGMS